jgi:O-antigen ligase
MDVEELNSGASSRVEVFHLAVRVIMDNPLVGTGLGGFRNKWDDLEGTSMMFSQGDVLRGTYFTQNQLLQVGTDSGFFGMILYVIFVAMMLRASRQVIKQSPLTDREFLRGYDAFLVAIFIGNQGSVWLTATSSSGFMVMLICGLILSYGDLAPIGAGMQAQKGIVSHVPVSRRYNRAFRPNQLRP